jgi:hypothetical protein
MHTCKQHRDCRVRDSTSKALRTSYVARITPCRYSVRRAIDRYRDIQSNEDGDLASAIVIALG